MAVYARLRIKEKEGNVLEVDRKWSDYEKKARKKDKSVTRSDTPSDAFNNFCQHIEAFKHAIDFDTVICIKFYDEDDYSSLRKNGGWLYIPIS